LTCRASHAALASLVTKPHHTPVGADSWCRQIDSSQGADKSTLDYCGLAQFSKYNKNMYYEGYKMKECMHMDPRSDLHVFVT
jgi:hypothetical protein